MKKIRASTAVAVLLLCCVAGCGSRPSADSGALAHRGDGPDGTSALSAVRDQLDYVEFASPAEMAKTFPVVVVGTISSVGADRAALTPRGDGTSERESGIVVDIAVSRTIHASAADMSGGHVYAAVPTGVSVLDTSGGVVGADGGPTLADFQASLPVGTRVVLLSPGLRRSLAPSQSVPDPGRFSEKPILEATHPQALVLDQGSDELDYWPGHDFERFARAVSGLS